jgi:hypothetical protein
MCNGLFWPSKVQTFTKKCKQFLNMIIAQSPTLAQCPSYLLFDVPTSNEETNEKLFLKMLTLCCGHQ